MKEIKIEKKLENEVESIYLLGKQVSDLAKKYPACWKILKEHFNLTDYPDREYIPDDIENVKVNLYVEIVKKINIAQKRKAEKIGKKLES